MPEFLETPRLGQWGAVASYSFPRQGQWSYARLETPRLGQWSYAQVCVTPRLGQWSSVNSVFAGIFLSP